MNCGRLSLRRLHTKRTLWKSAESPPECPCGLDELRVRTALLILPGKSERWSPDICIQPLTLHWESQHGETRFRCRKWGVCKMSIWGFYKILLVNKSMYSNTINLCDEVEEGRSIYVCDHRPMMLLEKIYNHRNICKLLLLTLWEIFFIDNVDKNLYYMATVHVGWLTRCLHVIPGQTKPPCQQLTKTSAPSVTERNHRVDPAWLSCVAFHPLSYSDLYMLSPAQLTGSRHFGGPYNMFH